MKKALLISAAFALVAIGYAAASDGQTLFNKCKSCHGQNGEKKALGVSAVIQGMSGSDIEKKLNAFKTGKFTDSKASMMQKQAAGLSAADIKALAAYISKL